MRAGLPGQNGGLTVKAWAEAERLCPSLERSKSIVSIFGNSWVLKNTLVGSLPTL